MGNHHTQNDSDVLVPAYLLVGIVGVYTCKIILLRTVFIKHECVNTLVTGKAYLIVHDSLSNPGSISRQGCLLMLPDVMSCAKVMNYEIYQNVVNTTIITISISISSTDEKQYGRIKSSNAIRITYFVIADLFSVLFV